MATATYAYKVRDRAGKLLEGSIEADSTNLVADKLRQLGYVPIAIDKRDESGISREIKIPGLGTRIKLKDVAVVSRQFATMINSGLSLLRSLYILAEQTENKALAKVLGQVRLDVERGSSLSQAIAKHPKAFSRLYVSMVRAGEAGGVLDTTLLSLADTIEKQVELRRKIKSAMTYPIVVFALVCLIVLAMLMFVVPTFSHLYSDLGGTLPLPTRILLKVSHVVTHDFPFVMVALGVGVWGLRRWVKTATGRDFYDRFKLRVPVFGKLVHKTALTRFSRTLGSLLRSGGSSAVLRSRSSTAPGAETPSDMTRAAAPATCGVAMLVPWNQR